MSSVLHVLMALMALVVPRQSEDLTQIADEAVRYAVKDLPASSRLGFKIEVRIGGSFDRVRTEALGRIHKARAAREQETIACANKVCRLNDAELFVLVLDPTTKSTNRAEVTVSAVKKIGDTQLHQLTMVLELVRSANGWTVSRILQAGES